MTKVFLSSLTRRADFDVPPGHRVLPRRDWDVGDFALVEVVQATGALAQVELRNGRMAELVPGDRLVGALGVRAATLEAVGTYAEVGSDGRMELLTSAGLLGKLTSISAQLPPLVDVQYLGHLMWNEAKLTMSDFVSEVPPLGHAFPMPTILIVGTSMSSGKTTSAKAIIRRLKERDQKVVGAKLTGAGRYRDILSMQDAGADHIFDFVDVGLPSSIVPPEQFRLRLRTLLRRIAATGADVLVAEAGASPQEPYNGMVVLEEVGEQLKFLVLCASDPYSVLGVIHGYQRQPNLVAGVATSTQAGIDLLGKLVDVPALNILDQNSFPELDRLLEKIS